MITFNKTHLQITTEELTPRKLDTVIITFNSPLKGILITAIDGYESSTVETEVEGQSELVLTLIQKNLLGKTFELVEFEGKDLLVELHNYYKAELEALNPEIVFNINLT